MPSPNEHELLFQRLLDCRSSACNGDAQERHKHNLQLGLIASPSRRAALSRLDFRHLEWRNSLAFSRLQTVPPHLALLGRVEYTNVVILEGRNLKDYIRGMQC